MENFLENLYAWMFIGAFYVVIYLSWFAQICKFVYYKLFRIPFIKQNDKFHPHYKRIDK